MSAARTPGHPVSIPNLGESQCALPAQHCPESWCSTSRPRTFLDKCRCAQALPCHCRSHLQPAKRPSGRLTSSPYRALVAPFLQLQIFQDACGDPWSYPVKQSSLIHWQALSITSLQNLLWQTQSNQLRPKTTFWQT